MVYCNICLKLSSEGKHAVGNAVVTGNAVKEWTINALDIVMTNFERQSYGLGFS